MKVAEAAKMVLSAAPEPKPEASSPVPESKPEVAAAPLALARGELEHFEQWCNVWRATVPDGTRRERLETSGFWSFNADRLSRGDVIWAETRDRRRAWRCTVLRGGRGLGQGFSGGAVMVAIDQEYVLPEQTLSALSWPPGFTATYADGRWVVRRDRDGAVMVQDAADEISAWTQLQAHASLRNF